MNSKQTSAAKTFKCLLVLSISLVLGNTVHASNLANIFTESFSFDNKSFQNPKKEKDAKPLWKVDQMPVFPGGEIAMQKFIMANLTYPVKAQAAREQGRVVVRFVVATDGVIKEVGVIRGLSPECDAEAVRVVEAMPKWNPGKQNCKAVPVYFTIPILFKLTNDENEEIDLEHIIGVETISVSDVREEFIDIQEVPKVKKTGEPFMAVEQMPSFLGGDQAMQKFIKTNLIYPALAQELDVQGRVAVRFVVDVDGTVTNAKVLRGIHLLCDREAIRLVNSMPKWNPGKQNGKVVPVYFTIPIYFRLDDNETEKTEPIDTSEQINIAVAEDFDFPDDHKVLVEESPQVGSYTSVEQMPSFPGGEQAMKKFIMTNLRYPVKAQENKIQGRVVTRFVVDKDGAIKDVELLRRVSPECDAEALRIIKSMPKWNPGKQKGMEVSVYYTLPVIFRL